MRWAHYKQIIVSIERDNGDLRQLIPTIEII